jgi:uncharacterized pyridoxamine 5'-phosphate oxidase family protein
MQRKFCNMLVIVSTFYFTSAAGKPADREIKKNRKEAAEICQEQTEVHFHALV